MIFCRASLSHLMAGFALWSRELYFPYTSLRMVMIFSGSRSPSIFFSAMVRAL